MKNTSKLTLAAAVLAVSVLVGGLAAYPSFAKDGSDDTTSTTQTDDTSSHSGRIRAHTGDNTAETEQDNSSTENETEVETETHSGHSALRKELRQKLSQNKLKFCEEHQSGINSTMSDIKTRSQRHYDRITAVYELGTAFVKEKNLTVDNYDALVAAVDEKQAAAKATLSALDQQPTFSCDSDGPKADLQAFRSTRASKVAAMVAYRKSVRTLLQAVKQSLAAQGSSNGQESGKQ
jgi:outer membrane murein-binding lipoprotein Lpp